MPKGVVNTFSDRKLSDILRLFRVPAMYSLYRATKQVQGSFGETEISVPRDRQGEIEPELVKKHQKDISQIEDKILVLYFEGVSTRYIQKTMDEMYDITVDDSRVSKVTINCCQ